MRQKKWFLLAVSILIGLALGGCAWLLQPLQAKLTATPTSGPAPLSVTFSAAGSTGPITSFTLDFGDGTDPYSGTDITVNIVHTYAIPGTYTAVLTVRSAQGAVATDSKTITVLPGTTASLGVVPTSGPAPLDVIFTVQAQAAAGRKIVYLKLDYGDGNIDEMSADAPSLSLEIPHGYAEPGTYHPTLTVEDNTGYTVTATVTVEVTTPAPTVTLEANTTSGPVPLTVTFTGSATAGTGAKLTKWQLSFGDGSYKGQENLDLATLTITETHTYTQTGSYTATFRVWDNLGQVGEKTVEITVQEAP